MTIYDETKVYQVWKPTNEMEKINLRIENLEKTTKDLMKLTSEIINLLNILNNR